MQKNVFRIKHYAGTVEYKVEFFIERNTDILSRDALYVLNSSGDPFIREMFPEKATISDMKRPETVGSQFRDSVQQLIENLLKKKPHYIRCLKPNAEKKKDFLDEELVTHQIRYLGLLEHTRVRRAGYCFRQEYTKFLERYKVISKDTWPNKMKGNPGQGCVLILKSINTSAEEYAAGLTKIFLKNAKTIFELEKELDKGKHFASSKIKATWKAFKERKLYQKKKESATKIKSVFRMYREKKKYLYVRRLLLIVSKVLRGYLVCLITLIQARKRYKLILKRQPKAAALVLQRACLTLLRKNYLLFAVKEATLEARGKWREVEWPEPHTHIKACGMALKHFYVNICARKYRKLITPERREILKWKSIAYDVFNTKKSYLSSVPDPFIADKALIMTEPLNIQWNKINQEQEVFIASTKVSKYHRNNPRTCCPRILVLTEKNLFVLDPQNKDSLKITEKIPLGEIRGMVYSRFKDGVFVLNLHGKSTSKGDCIFQSEDLIGFASRIYMEILETTKKILEFKCMNSGKIRFEKGQKEGIVDFVEVDNVERVTIEKNYYNYKIAIPKTK